MNEALDVFRKSIIELKRDYIENNDAANATIQLRDNCKCAMDVLLDKKLALPSALTPILRDFKHSLNITIVVNPTKRAAQKVAAEKEKHRTYMAAAPGRLAAIKARQDAVKQKRLKRENTLQASGFNNVLARVESEKKKMEHSFGEQTRHAAARNLLERMTRARNAFVQGTGDFLEDKAIFQRAVYDAVVDNQPQLNDERWIAVFYKIMSAIFSLGGLTTYGTGREVLGLFSDSVDLSEKLKRMIKEFKPEVEEVSAGFVQQDATAPPMLVIAELVPVTQGTHVQQSAGNGLEKSFS